MCFYRIPPPLSPPLHGRRGVGGGPAKGVAGNLGSPSYDYTLPVPLPCEFINGSSPWMVISRVTFWSACGPSSVLVFHHYW